jgi:hypothetical protein
VRAGCGREVSVVAQRMPRGRLGASRRRLGFCFPRWVDTNDSDPTLLQDLNALVFPFLRTVVVSTMICFEII